MAERTLADFGDAPQQNSSSATEMAPGQASNLAAASTHEEQLRPMEDEAEPIRALRTPKTVRDVEREAHEAAGHTVYRDWRVPCVTGSGRKSTSTTCRCFQRELEAVDCCGLRLHE